MHLPGLLIVFCFASSSVAQHGRLQRRDDDRSPQNETDVTPNRFIVEFVQGTDVVAAVDELTSRSRAKVLKVFNSDIFNGAAVETDEENTDSLQAMDRVSQAWPSRKIRRAPIVPLQSFSQNATAANYSIHYMTGVDRLHAEGILGQGVTVAVVDTGVDYNHPALGGGFGAGFKVAGGYDLVGDGTWPANGSKTPDADPFDQQGHGTHVSGIIAGNNSMFTGVAPEATLLMYKVFSQADNTDEDTLIDAFLMAYDANADIITSSIGGLSGWVNSAWAVVASRLVEKGVVVTISAGNDGQAGAYAASSGSSGDYVLAVASIEASTIASPAFIATFNLDDYSNKTKVAYRSTSPWYPSPIQDWPILPLSFDTSITDEACSPLAANTPNLTDKVVLVRRGGCNFSVKQQNLEPFGAKNILFYNNETPLTIPSTDRDTSQIAMITAEAGEAIIGATKAGGNVTADFTLNPGSNIVGVPYDYGGRASSFTSIGSTNELFIKPDIAAPGGQIFSTYPGGWAVLSGTSMACPYVAGIAALYIGQHGGRKTHGESFAKDLAMRIIASGEAVPWDDGTESGKDFGAWASVAQVGTGLINAVKVLNYETSLSFTKFALNDTQHFSRSHSVDITNKGKEPVTYTFEMQDFGGMETMNTDPVFWGVPRIAWFEEVIAAPKKMIPAITFSGGTFTVGPGETKTATFSFEYPQGLNGSTLPLYSGKVLINGSNSESISVPYLGLAADLRRDVGIMFQYPIGFPTLESTTANIPISQKSNFTFNLSPTVQDFPNLYTRLTYATTEMRWDIFEASWDERDWKYPPVVGEAGYVGSATSWSGAGTKLAFDPSVDNATDVIALPLKYLPRDIAGVPGTRLWWLGRLANGTMIPPGKYKMRFAALVPFGTPEHSDNWDIFQTPEFEVLPLS